MDGMIGGPDLPLVKYAASMDARRDALVEDLNRFVGVLARHNVECVVCGGFACVIHGVARVTADIDIAVRLSDANLRRVVAAARELSLTPRAPEPLEALSDERKRREWIDEKHARVFTLMGPDGVFHIDIFLEYPIPFDELYARAHEARVGGHIIRVSSKEDLIRAKQAVQPPRETDLRDIDDLKELIKREREARQ